MNGNDLMKMYETSYGAIKRNLDGVSNEESLHIPEPAGNCLNWVLGHIVASRGTVHRLTGGTPVLGEEGAIYRRGSEAIKSGDHVLDLGTLRGLLEDSQQQLIPALAVMSDESLEQPIPEQFRRPPLTGTVGEALMRLNYHEAYHTGQIGLLRRLAGKEGAIR